MKLAIVQLSMAWTTEENTSAIIAGLDAVRSVVADIALFPELAVTGFHKGIRRQAERGKVEAALGEIRTACRATGQAAIVGTPYFPWGADVPIWNACVVIDRFGNLEAVCPKAGLTENEALFFERGTERPVFTVGGLRCSVILCRETEDVDEIALQLSGRVEVVFWPGCMLLDGGGEVQAARFAKTLSCWLVQANWADALNSPDLRGMGASGVYAPSGDVVARCPDDGPGIGLVTVEPPAAEPGVPTVAYQWLPWVPRKIQGAAGVC
jgi:predicted amidohydrolase